MRKIYLSIITIDFWHCETYEMYITLKIGQARAGHKKIKRLNRALPKGNRRRGYEE